MPAPKLRRYSAIPSAATTQVVVVPTLSSTRAFVVSKLVVALFGGGPFTFTVRIGTQSVAHGVSLAFGEVYTETGLVVPSGESLTFEASGTTVVCSAFGQEVDN